MKRMYHLTWTFLQTVGKTTKNKKEILQGFGDNLFLLRNPDKLFPLGACQNGSELEELVNNIFLFFKRECVVFEIVCVCTIIHNY